MIATALKGRSKAPYLVSKVYPHNASRKGVVQACERSLKRLGVARIDLYLLHWRGAEPFAETIAGFERLIADGKIGAWGVSNLDAAEMAALWRTPGGAACQTIQALYNLARRWPEGALMPALQARAVPLMAYSPLAQGRLGRDPALVRIAGEAGMDPTELALAWTLHQANVFAVPKSAHPARIDAFLRAAATTPAHGPPAARAAAPPIQMTRPPPALRSQGSIARLQRI